jgi:tripartite-type tricarboxylate transporter receptor subunit TctC
VKLTRTVLALGGAFALGPGLFAASLPAHAAESLAGKTVTITVPVAPGGGYDTYARLVARHIRKHLPGEPTVIVKNMPGAGGLIAAGHLYSQAAKDGTEFAILQDANLFQQLTTNQHFPFDARKFGYLGALEKFVPIVLTWHTTSFHTFEDTRQRQMTVGSDGPGSSTDYFPRVLNAFFGAKFKIVRGYKGSAGITLAIERGELDGLASWCYDCLKAQKPNWVANKTYRILLQLALDGDPELDAQKIPTVLDLAKTPEEKQIVQLAFSGPSVARPFVTPPGLPPERLAMLRAAFDATAKDPEMIAEAKRGKNTIRYTPAAQMEEIISRVYATDPAIVQKMRKVMSE